MKSILISSLVTAASAGAVFQPADPTITPGPRVNYELFRKQDNNRFIGFISQSSGYTALSCSVGDRVWETNSLWGCCTTTAASCKAAIGCMAGSLLYSFTTGSDVTTQTSACPTTDSALRSATFCNTGLLYTRSDDQRPQTNYFCGTSAIVWRYYRVRPDQTFTVTSAATSSSLITTSTPSGSTSTTIVTSSSSSPPPSLEPQTQGSSGTSTGVIAGAVVGSIAGIAIIGLGTWVILLRRKRNKEKAAPAVGTAPDYQPMQQNGAGGYTSYHEMGPGSTAYQQQSHNGSFAPYGVGVSEQKPQTWQPEAGGGGAVVYANELEAGGTQAPVEVPATPHK